MRDATDPSLVALLLLANLAMCSGEVPLTQIWFLDPPSLTLFGRAWLMAPSHY